MLLNYEVQGNALVFTADAEAREYLKELEGYQARTIYVLECITGDGLEEILPEEIGALTSAPIFSLDATRDDNGEIKDAGTVYWFPDYAIRDEWQELCDTGRVEFPQAP